MAITISNKNPNAGDERLGFRKLHFAQVTFDSSYPTGGEAFDPVQFGLTEAPTQVIPTSRKLNCTEGVLDVRYDYTNKKLMVFCAATGLEIADTTNLSSMVVDLIIIEGSPA